MSNVTFEEATKIVGGYQAELRKNVANDILLTLYAYFKQAHDGDCNKPEPSKLTDGLEASYKWTYWMKVKGMTQEEAKEKYIKLGFWLLENKCGIKLN